MSSEDTHMRDLINALRSLDELSLPDNTNVLLTGTTSPLNDIQGGRILLDRIDELAHDSLIFTQGRLEGEPDYYNHELLKAEGYEVVDNSRDGERFVGIIRTRKGLISFE